MTIRRFVTVVTLASFVFMIPAQSFAQTVRPTAANVHVVTPAQLHLTVQVARDKAVAARKSVNQLLARKDVQAEIRRIGLSPDKVVARVTMLNDAQVVRLNEQLMPLGLQDKPAGLNGTVLVIVIGVVATVILTIILVQMAEDAYSL